MLELKKWQLLHSNHETSSKQQDDTANKVAKLAPCWDSSSRAPQTPFPLAECYRGNYRYFWANDCSGLLLVTSSNNIQPLKKLLQPALPLKCYRFVCDLKLPSLGTLVSLHNWKLDTFKVLRTCNINKFQHFSSLSLKHAFWDSLLCIPK